MIIRSQNKDLIINFSEIDGIYVHKDGEVFRVDTKNFILGRYSTHEKAIKVLDMIQEAYIKDCALYIDRENNAKVIPKNRGFQMPQDSEV